MLRLMILALTLSVVSGARSWTTIVEGSGIFPLSDKSDGYDPGRVAQMLQEGDPLLTRTTTRPTASPSITPEPTSYPTYPQPTSRPSAGPTGMPTIHNSDFPTGSITPSTSQIPSFSPKPTGTLEPSSLEPTYPPGSAPSGSPTRRVDNEDGNGGCPTAEVLYEVILYDQFGDGWEGRELIIERLGDDLTSETTTTQLVKNSQYMLQKTVTYGDGATKTSFIQMNNSTYPAKSILVKEEDSPGTVLSSNPVFQEGLTSGEIVVRYACLQQGRCYKVSIPGGPWSDEISWEIRQASLNSTYLGSPKSIVNGAAPSNCTFSVPGDAGAVPKMYCPFDCYIPGEDPLQSSPPSSAPVTSAPSMAPITGAPVVPVDMLKQTPAVHDRNSPSLSSVPSHSPSLHASNYPSLFPSVTQSNNPSSIPSDLPSTIPSELPTIDDSSSPSVIPTSAPSKKPSKKPSMKPTTKPTTKPSMKPTTKPSMMPTKHPSRKPTMKPSQKPTSMPSKKLTDSVSTPTVEPTWSPTISPTEWAEDYKTVVMGPSSYFGKFLENASTGDRHPVDTVTDPNQHDDDLLSSVFERNSQ